jgi:hypothetical protein
LDHPASHNFKNLKLLMHVISGNSIGIILSGGNSQNSQQNVAQKVLMAVFTCLRFDFPYSCDDTHYDGIGWSSASAL